MASLFDYFKKPVQQPTFTNVTHDNNYRQQLCMIVLLTSVWTGIAQFDPFGIKTATSIQSESIILRLIGGPWYQSKAQKITVVLIDNQYIEQMKDRWPLTYSQHAFILDTILFHKPKAVFYDVLFQFLHDPSSVTREDELDQFIETLWLGDENKIPIFIPNLVNTLRSTSSCESDMPLSEVGIEEELIIKSIFDQEPHKSLLGTAIKKTYVGWHGCGNRYPSFIMHATKQQTPAYALYKTVCDMDENFSPGCKSLKANEDAGTKPCCLFTKREIKTGKDFNSFNKPLMIRWGSGVTEEHLSLYEGTEYGSECEVFNTSARGFWDRLSYSLKQLGLMTRQGFQMSIERGKSERCTYTDTLHATWLLESPTEELYDVISHMIEDRVVLIGAQVHAANDYILSPVNDNVPGVYMHAMALDNYLEYGADYFKSMSQTHTFLIELFVTLLGHFIFFWVARDYVSPRIVAFIKSDKINIYVFDKSALLESTLNFFLRMFILLTLGFIVGFILWSFKFAPMDWAGILLVSLVAYPKLVYRPEKA